MPTVQFRGRDAVIEAYTFNNVGPWAIFCGKELLFSCEDPEPEQGSAFMREVLDHMAKGHSEAEYQLKIYKEVPEKGIMNNTPCNYSFRFRLYNDEEIEAKSPFTRTIQAVIGRLDQMEERFKKWEEEPEEEDEEPETGFQATLGAFLQRPEMANFLMGKIIGIVNRFFPDNGRGSAAMGSTGQGGGVPGQTWTPPLAESQPETNTVHPTTQQLYACLPLDERAKMDTAVYMLMKGDPAIGTHLLKLAGILQDDPEKYKMLCTL